MVSKDTDIFCEHSGARLSIAKETATELRAQLHLGIRQMVHAALKLQAAGYEVGIDLPAKMEGFFLFSARSEHGDCEVTRTVVETL